MNITEYISSGIIESYVLGLVTEEEKIEFELRCKQYPELVTARNTFEESLEQQYTTAAVEPPASLKTSLFQAINKGEASANKDDVSAAKIVSIKTNAGPLQTRRLPAYLAAASVIVLLGIGLLVYRLQVQQKELRQTNQELQAGLNSRDSVLRKLVDEQKMLQTPGIRKVNMVGTKAVPNFSANIYWDSTSAAVYLIVKNIPSLPAGQQYQLWSIIDGQASSLGVFDATEDKVILKMNNTQKADSFAITIEQKGGSTTPSKERIQSMGTAL